MFCIFKFLNLRQLEPKNLYKKVYVTVYFDILSCELSLLTVLFIHEVQADSSFLNENSRYRCTNIDCGKKFESDGDFNPMTVGGIE